MASEAQKRAIAKYRKAKVKQIQTCFYPAEQELFEWVSQQSNKSGYIKDLIRNDKEARKND